MTMTFETLSHNLNIPVDILKSIKARYEKYGEVCLSRKEHDKFGISENKMLGFIRKLRKTGVLIDIRTIKKTDLKGRKTPGNTYKISDVLLKLEVFAKDIIQKINDKVDGKAIMSLFGVTQGKQQGKQYRFKNLKGKLSGLVIFNSNVVYNHEKKKGESIFNYVKRKLNLTPKEAIIWFKDNTRI